MAISEKTAKILWGRAGATCSYPNCFRPLVVDAASSNDPQAVVGEMAHIVAHSVDGPRGKGIFRGNDRDGVENLLLLCPEHHTIIDQQPESHPVEWLYHAKERHEQWVRERLSPQQRFLQAHQPTPLMTDTLHSTLFAVTHMPSYIFSAPCPLSPEEITARIVRPVPYDPDFYWPFVCAGGQLFAFGDLRLRDGPFHRCICPEKSQRFFSQDWWVDPDKLRLYVMLLNHTLNKITGRLGLQLDKEHRRYYFDPDPGPQVRQIAYDSLQGKRTSRQVAWQPLSRRTGKPKNYWEHLAVSLQFLRTAESSWCLTIRPERRYTLDGFKPLEAKQVGRKATSRVSRIHNYELLTELHFWRSFLSSGSPRIVCKFATQQALIINTEILSTTVKWPGIPQDSRPFTNRRFQETLFSFATYEQAISSELGEEDEWEEEEWAEEEDMA